MTRRSVLARQLLDIAGDYFQRHAPYARVYRATNQLIGNAAWTSISFSNEHHDYELKNANGLWDVAAPTGFTIYTPGPYKIGGCINWESDNAGLRRVRIYVNGATVICQEGQDSMQGSSTQQNIHTEDEFAYGDFIELQVYQNSGGNLNVTRLANYSPEYWISKIG